MIRSFKDARAEAIFEGRHPGKGFPAELISPGAQETNHAGGSRQLADLPSPPATRLEALKGDREGSHAIRINNQFRLCFVWTGADAEEVEIVDYH